jgi:hypothetical protein
VAARRELANRTRDEANPKLIRFDLSRNADAHAALRSQNPVVRMPEIRKRLLAFLAEIG